MGNRPARHPSKPANVLPPTKKSSSNHHMNTHYNAMNQVLNQHLSYISSNGNRSSDQQITVAMHENALNMAIQQHLNATQRNNIMAPQAHRLVYVF